MAVTRLKRKAARNKTTAKLRQQHIKLQSATPVIKNVDVEAVKEEWAKEAKGAKKAAPKAKAKKEKEAEPKASSEESKGE